MVGFTDFQAQSILNSLVAGSYIGLFTGVGTDAGTGFTEVAGNGYARAQPTWNAATGSAPSTITNASTASFGTASGDWGSLVGFGLFNALAGGTLLAWDFLGNNPWFPFSATLSNPGIITAIGITAGSNPSLANGSNIVTTDEFGGGLPTGLFRYSLYTVSGLVNDAFNVGIATTTAGDGMVRQVNIVTVKSGAGPVTFSPGAFNLAAS